MSDENKAVMVDINDLPLDEEVIEINPDADPNTPPPPPPDGVHLAKLKLFRQGNDSGVQLKTDKNDQKYYQIALELRIVAPGEVWDDRPLFDRVNTIYLQSTGTMSIMGPLRALKVPVPSKVSKNELVKLLVAQLEGEPTVKVETQWGVEEEQDNGKWKSVRKGQKRFPLRKGPDGADIPGEHDHMAFGKAAQAKILRYLPA